MTFYAQNAITNADLKHPVFLVNFSHPGIALRAIGEHGKKMCAG